MILAFALSAPCIESASPDCDDGNPYSGYWWFENYWIPGIPTIESWFAPSPDLFKGIAVYYSPGLMEATAEWRGLSLDNYIGGVALMTCADIGFEIWILRESVWWGPFLVVDCARRSDIYGVIVHRKEAVEVDWNVAQEWDLKPGSWPEVVVSKIGPARIDPEEVINYRERWPVEFAVGWEKPPIYLVGENAWIIDGKRITYPQEETIECYCYSGLCFE